MLNISTVCLRINYADLAKMNRIRAAARKHGGIVKVQRYARDAYEGEVLVPSPWDEGADQHRDRIDAIKAAIR